MVDVTILLYLPLDTSLDDISFIAEWGEKLVGEVEENMILSGKDARYIRHRILPMMYRVEDEDEIAKELQRIQIQKLEQKNSNPKRTNSKNSFMCIENLPDWVNVSNDQDLEEEIECEPQKLDLKQSFVNSIKKAAEEFILPQKFNTCTTSDSDESDSLFSDSNSIGSSRISKKSLTSQWSNASSKCSNDSAVAKNKHIILSIATGYDRSQLKDVRKILAEKKVALLPIGIGDRGMIGLGGYYIKHLDEVEKIQDKIVHRLAHLV